MCRARRRDPGRDRGSAAVELTLLTPLLVLLLIFVVGIGRLAEARLRVNDAAHQAARAASLAREPATAAAQARSTATAALSGGGASCRSVSVTVDAGRFRAGGSVAVTVSCTTSLGDLALLEVPGSKTLSASFTAPVDLYRGTTAGGTP